MTDRRDAADGEAGQVVRLASRCAADVGSPVTAARRARSTRLWPDTRQRTGSRPSAVGIDEDQRLDDLAELGTDRRGRLGGGVGRLVEDGDLEGHALACGGIEDALDRGWDRGVGHGRSLASGRAGRTERGSIAVDGRPHPRRRRRAHPRRARRRLARLGRGVGLVIAADGGARLAADLGVAIDRWVGDGDSLGDDGHRRARAGRRPDRAGRPDKDESDTELAVRAALALGATGDRHRRRARRAADRPRARQHRASGDARAGGPGGRHPRRSDADLAGRGPGAGRRPGPAPARRATRRPRLAPAGRRPASMASRPDGLALPAVRRAARRRRRRVACRMSGSPPTPRSWSAAAGCSSSKRLLHSRMTMPAVGDIAPDVALPDETGTIHRLADQRGRWTVLYFYPKDDTPGCTIEACEFRDSIETIRERGADVWGISPQGAASQARLPREVRAAVHAPRRRGPRGRRRVRLVGREAELRQDVLGHRADDVPRRPGRPDRPGLAEGQARGPRRGGPRGARRAPGGPVDVIRRPRQEASLVGGDERSLGRSVLPGLSPAQHNATGFETAPKRGR